MSAYDTEQLNRLEPAYLANYGLTTPPFSDQHDDRFLYLDAERAQRLNLLQHMAQYSNLLLIVQGEAGVGKSSLLTRFINTKAQNWFICQVRANAFMDAGQLLYQVTQGFGVEQLPHDSAQLQELLYSRIATYHHNEQIPILLIDDAHELPKDALLAIFHLADAQVDNANLLRIVLFAEPQIEKILNAKDVRPLRERITHTMSIPALDEDTTAEYLKHRLAVAGFNGGSPFTPKMVKRIYKASAGNPARINQLAHETLDKGDFEPEEVKTIVKPAKPPRQYKKQAVIVALAVLVGAVLLFQKKINRLFDDKPAQTTIALPVAEQSKPAMTPTIPAVEKTPQNISQAKAPSSDNAVAPVPQPVQQKKLQEKIIPLDGSAPQASSTQLMSPTHAESTPITTAPSTEPEPVGEVAQSAPSPSPSPAPVPAPRISTVSPDPVPASNKPQTIHVKGEHFAQKPRVYVRWTDKDHEIPPARVKWISDQLLDVSLTVGQDHEKWEIYVQNPDNRDSERFAFKVATPAYQREQENSWSLSQPAGNYSLQLFASHDLQNARQFINEHHLGSQGKYFVSEHQGKDWYSVIYGSYPNQDTARSAISKLPGTLKKIKPWVRQFADIQSSIKAAKPVRKPVRIVKKSTPPPDSKVFTTALPRKPSVEQNESWIWSQDPSNYTLQLLGTRDLNGVKNLFRRYPALSRHAVFFQSRRKGQSWYAVIYGVYADKQKAREAIKRLPAALQKASPWVRQFSAIHAELSRSQ